MSKDFEIIIIGGGPAGASAAMYLNKLGFSVCIIEKRIFPRETLCGEFLSIEVVNALKELELFDAFIDLHPNKINSFRFFNKDSRSVHSHFSFNAFGLKRSTFDNYLLQSAKNAGVEVLQPYEVKSISSASNNFILNVDDTKGNPTHISTEIVVGAYGKQNPLDKQLKRHFILHKSMLNGVKFHIDLSLVNNFNSEEIHIYVSDGVYCGVNAVNDNAITFCFLQDRTASKESPGDQIRLLIRDNKAFANLFSDRTIAYLDKLEVYGTGNIFFGKREHTVNDIYLIGDAAGVIAPLAGDGIGMAFESSKLLAEILASGKAGTLSTQEAMLKYRDAWDILFNRRLKAALIIQKIILNRFLRGTAFNLATFFPIVIDKAVKATRNIY